jgi:GNAT superfamily N-acetyltransferase
VDRPAAHDQEPPRVDWYAGDRDGLRALFEEAEDSAVQLDSYIGEGRVLAARTRDEVLGHLQLVETARAGEIELKSMAVTAARRGTGIGTRLVEEAMASSRASGFSRMVVATAAADIDNLRFYQRRGFRFDGVEHDAFDAEAGYVDGILIDGIPLRDRVWLAQDLTS